MVGTVVGRESELADIDRFLAALPGSPGALVLAGSAGAGKTTLLREGLRQAEQAGHLVLRTLPAPGDVRLAFAGLADLLGSRLDEILQVLPPPQRRALAAALLIEDPPDPPPEPNVIAAAVKSALRALAATSPVLLVVDDVQWLDTPSTSALSFALRRLGADRVGILCAIRTDGPDLALPFDLGRSDLASQVTEVTGLSLGALHRMLLATLGTPVSRPTLRRIHAESGGNPFMALEIGRALARRGITRVGTGPLPVPGTLTGLVSERLAALPAAAATAVTVLAVMPDASAPRLLAAGVASDDLDAAVAAGVVEPAEDRFRFTHPLIPANLLASLASSAKRRLHALAAESATDREERARHRALSAGHPSAPVASELDGAALIAERRGAPAAAADLLDLAASLTPRDDPGEIYRRRLHAGRLLSVAGDTRAATSAFANLAADQPPGPLRAEALAHLGWTSEDDFDKSNDLLEQALAEAGDAPLLRARVLAFLSDHWAIRGDPMRSRTDAYRALKHAERAGDQALLASVLAHAFFCDLRCGLPVDEAQLERAVALEQGLDLLSRIELEPPSQIAGLYLMAIGRLDEARDLLEGILARAELEGLEYVRSDVMLRLSSVATRSGDPETGARLAAAGLEIAEQLDRSQLTSALLYGCSYAAMFQGDLAAVAEFGRRGQELSAAVGDRVYLRAHDAVRGTAELAAGNHAAAAALLRPLIPHLGELGRRFESSWVPEIAEALVLTGEPAEAARLLDDLEERYQDPCTLSAAARCRGQLAAAAGRLDEAVAELRRALDLRALVSREPVPEGRILLQLGSVQRRLKQRKAARESLGRAMELFEGARAAPWAARAAGELARVSGRAASAGELTATEHRVAELISAGLSNRAAAAELFVSVRAIESTLTKVYAKLGVRSRMELASRYRAGRA